MFFIKKIYFEDFEDLACQIEDKIDSLQEFSDIAIIAKYDKAKRIIEELINIGYSIHSVRIDNPEFDCYNDEYIISITEDGYIFCEAMKKENGYLDDESAITYISSDCNSKIISHVKCAEIYEFEMTEDQESDDDCERCGKCDCNGSVTTKSNSSTVSKDDDGTLNGFSVSWTDSNDGAFYSSSYSYYSNDENTVRRLAKEFCVNVD